MAQVSPQQLELDPTTNTSKPRATDTYIECDTATSDTEHSTVSEARRGFLSEEMSRAATYDIEEQPKAIYRSTRSSLSLQALTHLPAVIISIIILTLNFSNVFAQEPGSGTNTMLDALQFAAKGHESLLTFSMSMLVLFYATKGLLEQTAVPLGLLSTTYQTHNLLALFLPSFRSIAFARLGLSVRIWRLILLVVVASVLSLFAGPSSAIIMIPRLGWQYWSDPSRRGSASLRAFIGANYQQLFPSVVDSSLVAPNCLGSQAWLQAKCPSAGFPSLLGANIVNSTFLDTAIAGFSSINVTMSVRDSVVSRELGAGIAQVGWATWIISTSSDAFASALDRYWGNVGYSFENGGTRVSLADRHGEAVRNLQVPLVSVACNHNSSNSSTVTFPPLDVLSVTGKTAAATYRANPLLTAATSELGKASETPAVGVNFDWFYREGTNSAVPSLAAAFSTPLDGIYTCVLDARWQSSKIWLDPFDEQLIHTDFDEDSASLDLVSHMFVPVENAVITIRPDWAQSLNPPFDTYSNGSSSHTTTILEELGSRCSKGPQGLARPRALRDCLAVTLGLVVTDGLARSHDSLPLYIATNDNRVFPLDSHFSLGEGSSYYSTPLPNLTTEQLASNSSDFTEFAFEIQRYGYAWTFNRAPVYLAATVLIIHIIVVLLHLAYVICCMQSSKSWTNWSELLVLAMNSTPTSALHNTGAGIDKSRTWQKCISVVESAEDDGNLELVIEGDGADRHHKEELVKRKPRPEKKYG